MWIFLLFLADEGEEGVNINENDAQKDELSTGSASPSSTNSLDVPEVQTTTTSSLIKSKATIPRSKDARNRLAAHSLLLSRQQSNDSPHDDLERNIPVTLIDHETGLKRWVTCLPPRKYSSSCSLDFAPSLTCDWSDGSNEAKSQISFH